ncbi:thyroid adenoma-associated protein homolog [Lingula anatina]|uniref:tRNA (32-2'-O)-methyltransferase regulator THADA n=1 Tax=Lingula anatina TaxID=7574 RepID=A0A1S3IV52_LINAN|nr:thyroid adenoma-associated protein homolog [Lingula anatina]|eukprot:XP_013401424.1 thyroid adenoma-associated protein homolog [Lingula anatina]
MCCPSKFSGSGLTEGTTEDDKDDLGKKGIAVKLMPEYLVVCCWRCVKEASLLLGQLTQTAPIKREEDAAGGLLSFQQILSIGEYFKKQLLESIHRGAFELAYAGFIKMCHTLWRCTVRDLHQLPSSWLLDIMKDIQDESGTKLCATRRSAGVPFYVQAIVTTEPASTGGKCLIQALELLLKLALPSSEAEQERISQVHSLNILRALFRDSRLGEAVAPYVADGLQAGIAGFNSPYWAVRNASTLLFSAMMTRIFGVKRSKEDMSKKNCMTGRVFFHRYPSLFQFLLKGLDEGTKNISDQGQLHLHPGLYPILMVMGRLFPAMVEGNDPKLNLPAYIPFVISCAGSRVFKTRVMAGRALRPLVFKDQLGSVLAQLTGYLPRDQQQRHSQNLTHGILLQVEHLLKELSNLPSSIVQEALDVTVTGIMEAKWLIFRENRCPVTRAAYFHVAQAMLQSSQRAEVDKLHILVDHLAKVVFTELSSQDPSGYISPGSVEFNVAMANLSINCDEVWNKLKELLNIDDGTLLAFFLESPFYEVRLLVLQHLTLLMSTPVSKSSKLEESNRLFQKLISMATGLEHHQGCLAQVFLVLVHHPCAKQFPWKLSSGLWQSSQVQDLLIKVQKTSSRDEVRSAACRLIGVILPLLYNQLEQDQFEEDLLIDSLSIIKASCDSEQNVSVREACAMVLAQPEMTSILRDENRVLEHHVLHLWESVIILLQDEDMLVKDITARAVDHLNNFDCEEESEKKNQCLQPSMAIDICMKTMVELHHQTHPVECFTLLATWLLSEEKVEMEECVFDKGEINTYQEEVAFAQLLAKHLQKLLHYMNRGSGMKSLHASPNMIRTNEELDKKSFIMQTEQNTCVDEQQIRNLNQSSVLTKESLPDWSSDEGESPASAMADDDFINTTKRSEVLSLENVFQVRNPDFRHMDSRYATANKIKGQATKQLLSEMCGIQSVSTAPPRETSGKPPITTGKALGHEQDNSMNKGDDKAEFETVLHQTRHCLIKYLQEKVESPVVYGHSMPFVQMQKYQSEVISLYKHLLAAHCLELEQDVCTRFCYNQMIGQLKSKFDHFGMNCLLAEALE